MDRSSAHPGIVDPDWLRLYAPVMRVVDRVWPARVYGVERLPESDRYLLVANHSGVGMVESLVLARAWIEATRGPGRVHRPLAAMAHSTLFKLPGVGDVMRGVGAVEATREGAAHALARGAALLLFPGGDHEAMRPVWRARDVDFAGRRGWIRLAREHALPIVPMAITGSHVTAPTLGYSRRLAWIGPRFVGMHRLPFSALSIAAASAVLLGSRRPLVARVPLAAGAYAAGVFVPFVPSRIGFHLCAPLALEALSDDAVYDAVTGAIRDVLRSRPQRTDPSPER